MDLRDRLRARVAPLWAALPSLPLLPPPWAAKSGRLGPRFERAWSRIAERWPSVFEVPRSDVPSAPRVGSIDARLVGLENASPGSTPLDPVSLDPLPPIPAVPVAERPAEGELAAPTARGAEFAPAAAERAEPSHGPDTSEVRSFVATLGTADAWEARREAAAALGGYTGDAVVDALVRAVRDPSAEVAIAAVAALARQTDPRAAADLAEVLRDTAGFVSPFTRAAAVGAIAACQGMGALPMLLETLHDGDVEVSIAAVLAVAAIAPSESAKRLLALLEDRSGYYHPAVRLATAEALQQNGTMSSERALWLLATECDDAVRSVLSRSAHQHA